MKLKKIYGVLSVLVVLSMVLAACAPAVSPTAEVPVAATDAPVATEEPAGPSTYRY